MGYNYENIYSDMYIYYRIAKDLERFCNNDELCVHNSVASNIEKLERNLSIRHKILHNYELIYDFYNKEHYYRKYLSRINIFLGNLTIAERNEFSRIFPINYITYTTYNI